MDRVPRFLFSAEVPADDLITYDKALLAAITTLPDKDQAAWVETGLRGDLNDVTLDHSDGWITFSREGLPTVRLRASAVGMGPFRVDRSG